MIKATKSYFTNYFNFKGRTSRAEFWWAALGIFLLSFIVYFIAGLIFGIPDQNTTIESTEALKAYFSNGFVIISIILALLLIIPSISISVRRLHDINKSGWWYLITFVPYVGGLVLFIFCLLPSVNKDNKY